MAKPLQFVWWGWADTAGRWFHFHRYEGNIARVYRWSCSIGPLEIRRWLRRRKS